MTKILKEFPETFQPSSSEVWSTSRIMQGLQKWTEQWTNSRTNGPESLNEGLGLCSWTTSPDVSAAAYLGTSGAAGLPDRTAANRCVIPALHTSKEVRGGWNPAWALEQGELFLWMIVSWWELADGLWSRRGSTLFSFAWKPPVDQWEHCQWTPDAIVTLRTLLRDGRIRLLLGQPILPQEPCGHHFCPFLCLPVTCN